MKRWWPVKRDMYTFHTVAWQCNRLWKGGTPVKNLSKRPSRKTRTELEKEMSLEDERAMTRISVIHLCCHVFGRMSRVSQWLISVTLAVPPLFYNLNILQSSYIPINLQPCRNNVFHCVYKISLQGRNLVSHNFWISFRCPIDRRNTVCIYNLTLPTFTHGSTYNGCCSAIDALICWSDWFQPPMPVQPIPTQQLQIYWQVSDNCRKSSEVLLQCIQLRGPRKWFW
jgi:hypothetical protein